jgi:hypothetical protein
MGPTGTLALCLEDRTRVLVVASVPVGEPDLTMEKELR